MTVLVEAESRDDAAAFDAIATAYRTPADRVRVTQLAVVLARHTGARVQTYGGASDETASPDIVVMSASDASAHARRLLNSGIAVVVVPAKSRAVARIARIGIGYDGGAPAGRALKAASSLVATRPAEVEQVDVIHVDDPASAVGDAQDHVVNSRRSAVIAWWLEGVGGQIPAPVRIVRSVGDPADELAQLSHQFDLLVVGTRGRARLWRALTGSVSAKLMRTTCCPLLIVPPKRAALVSCRRFSAPIHRLSDRARCHLDERDEALIAMDPDSKEAVGVGRFIRTGCEGVAEVAVANDWHNTGLGTALLEQLAVSSPMPGGAESDACCRRAGATYTERAHGTEPAGRHCRSRSKG